MSERVTLEARTDFNRKLARILAYQDCGRTFAAAHEAKELIRSLVRAGILEGGEVRDAVREY